MAKNPHAVALGRWGGEATRSSLVARGTSGNRPQRRFGPRSQSFSRRNGSARKKGRQSPCPRPHERATPGDRPQSRRGPVGEEAVTMDGLIGALPHTVALRGGVYRLRRPAEGK